MRKTRIRLLKSYALLGHQNVCIPLCGALLQSLAPRPTCTLRQCCIKLINSNNPLLRLVLVFTCENENRCVRAKSHHYER